LLSPNGQQWYDKGEVTVDLGINNSRTSLRWPGNINIRGDVQPVRTELDYFTLFWPHQINNEMLRFTNDLLVAKRYRETSEQEMLKFFGIRLAMTLDRAGLAIPDYWETQPIEGSTFQPSDYGRRYKMSRHRFQSLSYCQRFAEYDEGIISEVQYFSFFFSFFLFFNSILLFYRILGFLFVVSLMVLIAIGRKPYLLDQI
jgi:hypothetical protein